MIPYRAPSAVATNRELRKVAFAVQTVMLTVGFIAYVISLQDRRVMMLRDVTERWIAMWCGGIWSLEATSPHYDKWMWIPRREIQWSDVDVGSTT